ncbi:uncharacterized protein METZ01_LOCUS284735 [marine metagenome]|uniref:Rhodanese domain-containing protein n=1 Tax=marine metagenome TaxID=408172 RepID=A0A382LAH6_9ZZZZ|tara:strand:- start:82 stop:477 length:396 start_codon:yes stop_codon:yes gene_type:complete
MKNILLLIMIFLVLFIIACNESKRNINTKKHQTFILAKDLKLKMENNEMLHIIDVRSKEEYYGNRGHIPGSKLVPLQTIASSMEKLKNIEDTIYVVCLSGKRSAIASKILRSNGINALNLSGGMLMWNTLK